MMKPSTSVEPQPSVFERTTPQTMQNRPTTASDDARDVELVGRALRLAQVDPRERDRDEADRDVEPEDPLPRDPVDDRAADDRADRDREAGDAAPRAEDRAALLGRRVAARIVSVSGVTIAAPRPWMRARDDQHLDAGRERGDHGGDREDRHADHEEELAPEAVAERRTGQQQHGEGQRVGVHHPFERTASRPGPSGSAAARSPRPGCREPS